MSDLKQKQNEFRNQVVQKYIGESDSMLDPFHFLQGFDTFEKSPYWRESEKVLRKIKQSIKQYREAPGDYPEDDHEHAVKCIYEIEDLLNSLKRKKK